MKKIALSIILTLVSIIIFAQENPKISITKLTNQDGKIYVDYSILYSAPEQLFEIILDVKTSNGTPIQTLTTSGDIGTNIKGGSNKQIIWDYEQDGVFLNEDVSVQIISNLKVDPNYYSTSKLIFASTLLPGKGVTMLDRSKSYLTWTIAGYGLAGASVGSYFLSKSSYTDFSNATLQTERDFYYSKYQIQTLISGISALSAVGIWGVNYFRLFATKNRIKYLSQTTVNWQITPTFEYLSRTNMITFFYKF